MTVENRAGINSPLSPEQLADNDREIARQRAADAEALQRNRQAHEAERTRGEHIRLDKVHRLTRDLLIVLEDLADHPPKSAEVCMVLSQLREVLANTQVQLWPT